MSKVNVIYLDLSPGIQNSYNKKTHKILYEGLNIQFPKWIGFQEKHKGFDLNFFVCTKVGTTFLYVKGPTISKRHQVVEFSIFLPDKINGQSEYVDLVFEGILTVVQDYGVSKEDVEILIQQTKAKLSNGR